MSISPKQAIGYGVLAAVTAPLWLPIAFVGYVGVKATRFAFKHATPVAFALCIGGGLAYVGCEHREKIATALERVSADKQVQQASLEQRVETPSSIAMIDEPGYAYRYVRDGETLSRIAEDVTGDADAYRILARENAITNPDNVTVGTLLRIPDRLCQHGATHVYDRVPSLNSVTLPGTVRLSEKFGVNTNEVIAVNRVLGMSYSDAYPYPSGARVVWFSSEQR